MPPRALVVEDDRDTREALRAIIEGEGWIVDVAPDGESAIDQLSRLDYALILLDIILPKISGAGVMEHLQAAQPAVLENVVVVTGVDTADIAQLFPAVRATLAKPVLPARLRATARIYMVAWEQAQSSGGNCSVA